MDNHAISDVIISTPPSYDQTKYLCHIKAKIMEKKFPSSLKRVAVKLSNTTFILCEPQEKEVIIKEKESFK